MQPSKIAAIAPKSVSRFQARSPLPNRYTLWTIEELRQLACQLHLPDVYSKTRLELLELLAGHSRK